MGSPVGSRVALNWGPAEAGPRMGDGRRGSAGARRGGGVVTKGPIRAIHPGHQGDGGWEAPGPSPALCHERPAGEPEHTSRSEGPKGSWGLEGTTHRASCGCAGRERRALPERRSLEAGYRPRPFLGRASWQRPLASAWGAQDPRERGGPGAAPHILTGPPAPGAAPGSGRRVRRLEGYVTEHESPGPRLNPQASTSVPPVVSAESIFCLGFTIEPPHVEYGLPWWLRG